jgi:thioesterase domain-containing protein/acyl carrier protein
VISLGGATEASIWSIAYPVGPVDPSWTSIPYGAGLRHQTVQVLGDSLEPCPVWVVGEIHIGGVGLARGYLGDPELTAARFVTHPRTGERLYRTGDLGRLVPDGNIELLGREDNQVKVGGHRIELGDVEAALRRHPGVAAAVVVARGDRQRGMQLVAYYTPTADRSAAPGREQLRELLKRILPGYMVPRAFVALEVLPTSANGKIDRKALLAMPLPAPGASAASPDHLPAQETETQAALRAIWADVLEREVGPADDFFELGGNSLLAVRVMARIERELGPRLPASTLLDAPTVAGLARILDQRGDHARAEALVPIRVSAEHPPIFLIHPIGGSVLCYRELADALAGKFSVWGIQAPRLAGHPSLDTDVQAMAARYLEEINRVHPTGALVVAGWSFGGIVAFEIARRAVHQGRSVRTLLIDSYLVDRDRAGGEGGERESDLVRRFYADLCRIQGRDAPREPGGDGAVVLGDVFERAQATGIVPREVTAQLFRDMYEVFRANTLAHASYAPEPATGPDVTIAVAAASGGLAGVAPAARWKDLARRVRFVELDGDHYNIVAGARARRLAELFARDAGARSHIDELAAPLPLPPDGLAQRCVASDFTEQDHAG